MTSLKIFISAYACEPNLGSEIGVGWHWVLDILLTAPSNVILARKNELDKEGIDSINKKIDYLSSKKGYYKILNTGTPKEAVANILNVVFEQQHSKNLKRLRNIQPC